MEHHSNLVPWQQLCQRTGATLRWFRVTDEAGSTCDLDVINERTKIVAVVHQSNVLGVIPPVAEIARAAHEQGALVLVDGAQSVPHQPSTWPRSASTSSPSPATRCSAPRHRRAVGPGRGCSRRCRRSSAAAR